MPDRVRVGGYGYRFALATLIIAASCGDDGRPPPGGRDASLDASVERDAPCADRDSDGLCDADDPCPLDPDTSPEDLDGDGVPDVCDPDRDGDGSLPPGDCDDADPARGPDAPEVCGNTVDEDCDGVVGTEAYYRLPISVNLLEDLRDGVVRVSLDDPRLVEHLRDASSLRAYPVAVPEPWAEPYTGWPLYVEEATESRVSFWLRVTLPAEAPNTVHLYYGADAASVSDPRAVFDYFETFDDESVLDDLSLESSRSGASQAIDPTDHHSPPASLRNQVRASSGCGSDQWARSTFSWLFEEGAWHFSWVGHGAGCSSCTISQALWVDGELQARVPAPGPEFAPGQAVVRLSAGEHRVSVGMHSTTICSGTFAAWTDDLRFARTTDPPPGVVYDAAQEEEVCR